MSWAHEPGVSSGPLMMIEQPAPTAKVVPPSKPVKRKRSGGRSAVAAAPPPKPTKPAAPAPPSPSPANDKPLAPASTKAASDRYAAVLRQDRVDVLERMGERAWLLHDQPDAGMWELRTRARVHTSSALMSWAACDRLAKIAATLQLADRASHWQHHADRMRAEILDKSWCEERQAFAESFGGHELDASVLLMAEVGFLPPRDPRFVATVDALEAALVEGPYMRRYESADDFGVPEAAFTVCTFWLADALATFEKLAAEPMTASVLAVQVGERRARVLLADGTIAGAGRRPTGGDRPSDESPGRRGPEQTGS